MCAERGVLCVRQIDVALWFVVCVFVAFVAFVFGGKDKSCDNEYPCKSATGARSGAAAPKGPVLARKLVGLLKYSRISMIVAVLNFAFVGKYRRWCVGWCWGEAVESGDNGYPV